MKRILFFSVYILFCANTIFAQTYHSVLVSGSITNVQPMTGIVLWNDNEDENYRKRLDAISLEYSYVKYNDIVKQKGSYNWAILENLLNDIASRGHQAIIRFYFVYPKDLPLRDGRTTVPEYIKAIEGYADFKGKGDGVECYFPDWRNQELKDFTLEFYTEFAKKYDNDPRLAFVQTGFGLWSEYHTWSGQITVDGTTYKEAKMLGIGFPSKEFQETFLKHIDTVFTNTPWSISIDAADADYTPMEEKPALKSLRFGLFDDSFMSEEYDSWNRLNWDFFGTERYRKTPAGGEFNYYTDADQKGVLNPAGWRGRTYEQAAKQQHISYMIGNDQPEYQPMSRIKEASMASGYKFKIERLLMSDTNFKVTIKNIGIAPIYYDAFATINGVRSIESLKGLAPDEQKEYIIETPKSENPILSIECDRLLANQVIQFEGDTQSNKIETEKDSEGDISVQVCNNILTIISKKEIVGLKIINLSGKVLKTQRYNTTISLSDLSAGIYIVSASTHEKVIFKKITVK